MTVSNSGAGELEFSISAVWVGAPASPTAVFVTPSPDHGNVAPAGSLDVDLHFATGDLEPGDYEAEIRVASNDPATPLVSVPATLTVTSAPNLQIPGELITQESEKSLSAPEAGTSHLFPVPAPPVGGAFLELIAEGNYETGRAEMIAGGATLGSVGDTGTPCGTGSGSFVVTRGQLAGLAAGSDLVIDVNNSEDVGPDCGPKIHTIRLSYSPERESLEFGSVPVGDGSDRSLSLLNGGTETLTVSSITSDRTDFVISPTTLTIAAGDAASITVTFSPIAGGDQTGTLSIASNDPDRPVVQIQLTGEGG